MLRHQVTRQVSVISSTSSHDDLSHGVLHVLLHVLLLLLHMFCPSRVETELRDRTAELNSTLRAKTEEAGQAVLAANRERKEKVQQSRRVCSVTKPASAVSVLMRRLSVVGSDEMAVALLTTHSTLLFLMSKSLACVLCAPGAVDA